MPKRPPLFRATDLARALRAGAMAGVSVSVSIAKTGELTVSPMPTSSPPADAEKAPFDAWKDERNARSA
jgi:hypothetical protein